MAAGPIDAFSKIPDTSGNAAPYIYVGSGSNTVIYEEGMGVAASISADVLWMLHFKIPKAIPTGTAKLRLTARASATSGVAALTIKDGVDDLEGSPVDPSTVTLTTETSQSWTWGAGDTDKPKVLKLAITPTLIAGGWLVVAALFTHTTWTLAVRGWFDIDLIWE